MTYLSDPPTQQVFVDEFMAQPKPIGVDGPGAIQMYHQLWEMATGFGRDVIHDPESDLYRGQLDGLVQTLELFTDPADMPVLDRVMIRAWRERDAHSN